MTVQVTDLLKDLIRHLIGDREAAAEFRADPHGVLAANGITDHDLSKVDVAKAVGEVCADPSTPQSTRSALQSYTSGSSGPHTSGPPSVEHVAQHLNYVTYATYEGDEYFTDNSVNVHADHVEGDVDVNAATGAHSQVIDGDNFGNANTGDGAVQAGRDIEGGVNTGTNTGIVGRDVDHAVVGDHNQTAQVEGSADQSVINFGSGQVNNLPNAHIDDSAVSFGSGGASNVSHNDVDHGSSIATTGGHASGSDVHDDHSTNISTVTEVDDHSTHHTTVDDHHSELNDHSHVVHTDHIVAAEDVHHLGH